MSTGIHYKVVYDFIGRKLQQPNESTPLFTYLGLLDDYNGVDIHQTDEHFEITASDRL
jgi:hypothetical protein